jgi:hypothetical protein
MLHCYDTMICWHSTLGFWKQDTKQNTKNDLEAWLGVVFQLKMILFLQWGSHRPLGFILFLLIRHVKCDSLDVGNMYRKHRVQPGAFF